MNTVGLLLFMLVAINCQENFSDSIDEQLWNEESDDDVSSQKPVVYSSELSPRERVEEERHDNRASLIPPTTTPKVALAGVSGHSDGNKKNRTHIDIPTIIVHNFEFITWSILTLCVSIKLALVCIYRHTLYKCFKFCQRCCGKRRTSSSVYFVPSHERSTSIELPSKTEETSNTNDGYDHYYLTK